VIKEMSKVKIFALLLMMLLSITTSVATTSANENNEIPELVKFNALIKGTFWVGIDISSEQHTQGVGKGRTGISGSASEFTQGDFLPAEGDELLADSIDAGGFVSVGWTSEDESKHRIQGVFYNIPDTKGIFSKNNDLFFVNPMSPVYGLWFTGIHVSGSETQEIKGIAMFVIAPYKIFGTDPTSTADLCMFVMIDEVSGMWYWLYWSSEEIPEFQMSGNPPDPVLLPSAQIFKWNLEAEN
jgi:hypothetical protein